MAGFVAVGSEQFQTNTATTLTSTLTTVTLGDVIFLVGALGASGLTPVFSGGGVTTWQTAKLYNDTVYGATLFAIWGVVTTVGTNITLTATWGGTSVQWEFNAREFTPPAGTVVLDKAGSTSGSGTALSGPSLVAAGSNELYFGYLLCNGTPTVGTTSGFTYVNNTNGNLVVWDGTASGTLAPTATQTTNTWSSLGALLTVASAPKSGFFGLMSYKRSGILEPVRRLWKPERRIFVPQLVTARAA
jgi:hypothetical protein